MQYYQDNRDEINERHKKYNENHRDEKREYDKQYYQDNYDKINERHKQYYQDNRDEINERHKKYNEDNQDEIREYHKQYYQDNRDELLKKDYIRLKNIISELCEQYDDDLEQILKNTPSRWHKREAIMQVEYGISYADAMYKKMQLNTVCEVTGSSDDLVIHHLDSFSLYPEKGADLDNLVRITKEIHEDFHNIYGYGGNTREQWFEFLEKNRNIYI